MASSSLDNNNCYNQQQQQQQHQTSTSTHRGQAAQAAGGTTHAKSLLEAKVVILGTQGVGKTSLVHRYTSGHFNASSIPSTIGASFLTKKLVVAGTKVRLQIWDTAGQERFRSMAPMYYRGSNAAIIVYDITSMTSFLDVKTWLEELRRNMNADLVIHIVGSKSDLSQSREVALTEAKRIIRTWVGNDFRFEGDEEEDHEEEMQEATVVKSETLAKESRNSISKLNLFGSSNNINDSNDKDLTSIVSGKVTPTTNSNRGTSRFGNAITSSLTFQKGLSTPDNTIDAALRDSKDRNKTLSTSPSSSNNSSSNSSSENQLSRTLRSSPTFVPNPESSPPPFNSIQISEVSAKDDEGIEDVFLNLTSKLVERKLEIEKERRRRDRESIMIDSNLDDANGEARSGRDANHQSNGIKQSNGWSCC